MDSLKYSYISQASIPDSLARDLKSSPLVAIDTEADSLHHYYHKVCLIQLNVDGNIYIIDPFQLKKPEEFFSFLKHKVLIFHGADYDLRILRRDFNFVPYKIFDTMIASQFLGYQKQGLADLVQIHFDTILSKGPQKFDWSKRPLPEKMLTYAANDVFYLIELYRILTHELALKNRLHWVEENCKSLILASKQDKEPDKEAWRIKGAFNFSREELSYLKAFWNWREREAQRVDVPVFKVLRNESMLELARWCALEKSLPISEAPNFRQLAGNRERLSHFEQALAAARRLSPYRWPKLSKPTVGRKRDVSQSVMEHLKETRDKLAEKFGIEPGLIMNHKTMTNIASLKLEEFKNLPEELHLASWQRELFEGDILNFLRKSDASNRA